jgi:hypothetical protein
MGIIVDTAYSLLEAFIISLFKLLPNYLLNVIGLILFREIESSVLSAKVTSSMK